MDKNLRGACVKIWRILNEILKFLLVKNSAGGISFGVLN